MGSTAFAQFLMNAEMQQRSESALDPLTGLLNRTSLPARFAEIAEQAALAGDPVCVVVCDLDGFKAINDEHGHDRGDAVLRDAALLSCASSCARSSSSTASAARSSCSSCPASRWPRAATWPSAPAPPSRQSTRRPGGHRVDRRRRRPRRGRRLPAPLPAPPTPPCTRPSAAGATASSWSATRARSGWPGRRRGGGRRRRSASSASARCAASTASPRGGCPGAGGVPVGRRFGTVRERFREHVQALAAGGVRAKDRAYDQKRRTPLPSAPRGVLDTAMHAICVRTRAAPRNRARPDYPTATPATSTRCTSSRSSSTTTSAGAPAARRPRSGAARDSRRHLLAASQRLLRARAQRVQVAHARRSSSARCRPAGPPRGAPRRPRPSPCARRACTRRRPCPPPATASVTSAKRPRAARQATSTVSGARWWQVDDHLDDRRRRARAPPSRSRGRAACSGAWR